MRACRKCLQDKSLEAFPYHIHRTCHICKSCVRARLLVHRRSTHGFLVIAYNNMKGRVEGRQGKNAHLYKGLPLLDQETFFAWAKASPDFRQLHRLWVASGYNPKLTPSVNRMDPTQGYIPGNIEWMAHSLNSGLARHRTDGAFQRIYASVA